MDSSKANHGRRGTPWRRLRARVLRQEPNCYLCGDPATQVDHVLPLSLYPELAHVRDNLRGICGRCNASKGAKLPGQTTADPLGQQSREW